MDNSPLTNPYCATIAGSARWSSEVTDPCTLSILVKDSVGSRSVGGTSTHDGYAGRQNNHRAIISVPLSCHRSIDGPAFMSGKTRHGKVDCHFRVAWSSMRTATSTSPRRRSTSRFVRLVACPMLYQVTVQTSFDE